MPAVTVAKGKWGSASLAVFLVDGYNLLAAKVQSVRLKKESLTEPTDGVGDSSEANSPVGMSKVEVAHEGAFFDTTAGSSHAALSASLPGTPQAAQRVLVVGFAGNTIGQPFTGLEGAHTSSYEVLAERGKLQRANATHVVSGAAEEGVILHALTAETADASTDTNSVDNTTAPQRTIPITSSAAAGDLITCPVPHGLAVGDTVLISDHAGSTPAINGIQTVATVPSPTTFSVSIDITVGGTGGTFLRAKTNAGGSAYLEMTAVSLGGHTAAQVTIRHSDDDAAYVDLVAFTARTAFGAERVTVAGAVRRYLAQSLDFTGAGSGPSTTYLAGFARN